MEIYCGGRQLLSVPVPTRGEVLHVPIFHRTAQSLEMKNTKTSSLPNDRIGMFETLYQRNYTGPIYDGNYVVTGWREVEL